jgi:hypothetical protein
LKNDIKENFLIKILIYGIKVNCVCLSDKNMNDFMWI